MDTVTIDGQRYEVPDSPLLVTIDMMRRARGIDARMISPLNPTYVRPDDTVDDAL